MSIIEIVLIIAGVVVFALGYLLPAKKRDFNIEEEIQMIGEEEVRKLVEREVEGVKEHISDIVDETVSYAMEKTERSMDRVTNEKMMAVNEYSDTVLEEINKNHKEVLFLYDMLNDKHENLKDTVSEAARTAEEVKQTVRDVEISAKEAEDAVKSVELTVREAQEAAKQAVQDVIEYGKSRKIREPEIINEEGDAAHDMSYDIPLEYEMPAEQETPMKHERTTVSEMTVDHQKSMESESQSGFMTYAEALRAEAMKAEADREAERSAAAYEKPIVNEAQQIEDELSNIPEEKIDLTQIYEPETAEDGFVPIAPPKVEIIHDPDGDYVAAPSRQEMPLQEEIPDTWKPELNRTARKPAETKSVNIQFANGRDNGRNSNERILELHKAGKSNMAIAKELGLGIGEVKLVIDLFESMN